MAIKKLFAFFRRCPVSRIIDPTNGKIIIVVFFPIESLSLMTSTANTWENLKKKIADNAVPRLVTHVGYQIGYFFVVILSPLALKWIYKYAKAKYFAYRANQGNARATTSSSTAPPPRSSSGGPQMMSMRGCRRNPPQSN